MPLSLIFKRTRDDACGTVVSMPDLNVTRDLPLNVPVTITVQADGPGKYEMRCGVGGPVGHLTVL